MQMSNAEIVAKFNRADDKKAQIGILADLNGCDKEKIKQILLEGGVPESELPKARGPKPKETKEQKYKPGVYSKVEKTTGAVRNNVEYAGVPALDDEDVPGAITGGEGDVEGYKPTVEIHIPTYRAIEQIVADGPKDAREAERLERYNLIPEPVKELCITEQNRLIREILRLEKRRDQISDYLNGEVVC